MPFLDSQHSGNMTAPIDAEEVLARFEELSVLEAEFEDAELELSRELPAAWSCAPERATQMLTRSCSS